MDELKACPICGGPAAKPYNMSARSSARPRWLVGCANFCISLTRSTRKAVVDAWNTRAIEAALAIKAEETLAENERLRDFFDTLENEIKYYLDHDQKLLEKYEAFKNEL